MTGKVAPKGASGTRATTPETGKPGQVASRAPAAKAVSSQGWEPKPPAALWRSKVLWSLVETTGYAALPSTFQDQLRAALTGTTPRSSQIQTAVANLLSSPKFVQATGKDQASFILSEMDQALPLLATYELGALSPLGAPFTLRETAALPTFEFSDRKASARVHRLELENQSIDVVVPSDGIFSPPHQHTVEEVAAAVAQLLPAARRLISQIVLSPRPLPNDERDERVPELSKDAYMTFARGGQVTIYPQPSLMAANHLAPALAHEAGHALGAEQFDGFFRALTRQGWNVWEEAMAADQLPPSKYGLKSVEEDVAETALIYLCTEGTAEFEEYRALFPRRFALLDQMMGRIPPL
jgi:hypothetical protein